MSQVSSKVKTVESELDDFYREYTALKSQLEQLYRELEEQKAGASSEGEPTSGVVCLR